MPHTHRRRWDFSADGIRRSIEDSLGRLGLDRVDIVYLHDPDDHAEAAFREGYPALEKLRAEGVVGAIGAGMNQTAMLTRFLRETDVDVVLCAGRLTLLDHSALDTLLPEAAARHRDVVVGGVFNSGLLADPRPDAAYDYAAAPAPSWTGPCASVTSPKATVSRCAPPPCTIRCGTRPSPGSSSRPAPRTRCATRPPSSADPSRTRSGTTCARKDCSDMTPPPVVDAHHHVWDLAVRDQDWITGEELAPSAAPSPSPTWSPRRGRRGWCPPCSSRR